MYSKDQASAIKQAFWTAFGQYMSLQPAIEGEKVNWMNYKTGLKHLYFRMHADQRIGSIAIEISHPDPGIQELMFEQFKSYDKVLQSYLNEEWDWALHTQDDYGRTISRISKTITNVNIFRQEDWPALISFFKPRIMGLDQFWSDAKYGFDLFK